ncbi:MAG: hypothetical protein ACRCXZ_00135, partial [Patescibacteria group bacterium]
EEQMATITVTHTGNTVTKTNNGSESQIQTTIIENAMTVQDDYHSMEEIYEHRMANFVLVAKLAAKLGGISCYKTDIDGGWFIGGILTPDGKQIGYHLKATYWANFPSTTSVPEYDGHNSADSLDRILTLIKTI